METLLTWLCCNYCRAAERRDDMVGLLHTKGYSHVIDMSGEEKNGRHVLQQHRQTVDHLSWSPVQTAVQLHVSSMPPGLWPYAPCTLWLHGLELPQKTS